MDNNVKTKTAKALKNTKYPFKINKANKHIPLTFSLNSFKTKLYKNTIARS